MNQTHSLKQKINQLLIILLPIFVTQISLCAMAFFDTTMSGHASADDLAGVAIGANIWMPVFTGLNGILYAIVPIISQLLGANCREKIPFALMQGIYLAAVLAGLVTLGLVIFITPILNSMGISSAVYDVARRFLLAIAWGIGPLFVYSVLRCFMDALGQTRISMLIMLAALPINVLLNYLLIFGKCGFPKLGGVGAGYASATSYWCAMLIGICVIKWAKPFKEYQAFARVYRPSYPAFYEQLRIGMPIGFAIFCETSIFGVVALLMSRFSTATIAAHQAAMNFVALLYMVPLSISMALTIVVGFETGAQRLKDARQYSYLGIGIAVIMAVICATALFQYNEAIAKLYSDDAEVLQMVQQFLLYAAFFQLSDAVAAPIQGALRGYKDVTVTFCLAIVSYWIVGLPVGYVLANYFGYAAFGYWIGLISGLGVGAVCLLIRLKVVQRRAALYAS